MVGNFFTRPAGLRPTPATCFPPKKPPLAGVITGYLRVRPQTLRIGDTYNLEWEVENTAALENGTQDALFTCPGLSGNQQTNIQNGQPGHTSGIVTAPTGIQTATLRVSWDTGQVTTFPANYLINP